MRFPTAWAEVTAQNVTLRAVVAVLGTCTLVLSVAAVKLSIRAPLLIERTECFSRVSGSAAISPADSSSRTPDEIAAFAREAVAERFNSAAELTPGLLSDDEFLVRTQEQKELSSRSMSQTVIVRAVKPAQDGASVAVDADRLVSVAQVRSAFPFPLLLHLASTARTTVNPYGLILEKALPQESGGSK